MASEYCWQSMDTAPVDKWVTLCYADGSVCPGCWDSPIHGEPGRWRGMRPQYGIPNRAAMNDERQLSRDWYIDNVPILWHPLPLRPL